MSSCGMGGVGAMSWHCWCCAVGLWNNKKHSFASDKNRVNDHIQQKQTPRVQRNSKQTFKTNTSTRQWSAILQGNPSMQKTVVGTRIMKQVRFGPPAPFSSTGVCLHGSDRCFVLLSYVVSFLWSFVRVRACVWTHVCACQTLVGVSSGGCT